MRTLITFFSLLLMALPCVADDSDPLSIELQRTVTGRVVSIRSNHSLLVIRPRAAWATSASSMEIEDRSGKVLWRGLVGRDLRDAVDLGDKVVVAEVATNEVLLHWVVPETQGIVRSVSVAAPATYGNTRQTVEIIGVVNASDVVVRIGSDLYALRSSADGVSVYVIEKNVTSAAVFSRGSRYGCAFSYSIGASSFVTVVDSVFRAVSTVPVPTSDLATIHTLGSSVVMVSHAEGAAGSIVSLIDPRLSTVATRSIPVEAPLVCPFQTSSGIELAMITTSSGVPHITTVPLGNQSNNIPSGKTVTGDLGSPLSIQCSGDTIYALFAGGLVLTTTDGASVARNTWGLPLDSPRMLKRSGVMYIVEAQNGTAILQSRAQSFWWLYAFSDLVLRFVVPLILAITVVAAWILYRRQRRFFEAMLDLPGAGIVFVLDANGRLVRTNERAAALLRITPNVPMGRLFRSYTQRPGLEELTNTLSNVVTLRSSTTERVVITEADEQHEYMVTSIPLNGLLGRAVGTIITGVDITEALERRRLVNWAQLAHDMQTNLSTIRLNAEQLDADLDSKNLERRRRILFQVGVLIQRVRDLISVGRSDDLTRVPVHSAELCTEIRHEFDPALFPHVTFQMKLRGTMMHVDRLKVSRAVRNAVENGIKALRGQSGTIEISTWFDRSYVFIRVSDTGVGMDADTLANMMKPYFTTAKDGTGTGIGTMIMQHVMNLHGGALRVTSEPGVGTQVIFRIPNQGAS